ncbi:MAG TPA: fluoride efflux transporter CrcB [Conexibacter sp.]|jgi:CrcB protein
MSALLLWLGVGVLGGAGSVARLLVDGVVAARVGRRFPTGILAVNLSGAAVLGLLAGLALGHDAMLLAGTALIGGYTTFSTWMLDSERLAEAREPRLLALNVIGSLLLGAAAAALGHALGAAL